MTLDLLPRKLPTLEPVKRAAQAALEDDLDGALAYVTQLYPDPPLRLPAPKAIRLATEREYTAISAWPTLTIESAGLRPREEGEQRAMGQLRGGLQVRCWLEAERSLDQVLDRYAAAVWLVLLNHDPLGGTELARDSLAIVPDPEGGSPTRRCVVVAVDVLLRV